jgi:hypothetical protein
MKTVGSIITIVMFCFVMLYGSVLIFNQAGVNNALDDESLLLISQYDKELEDFTDDFRENYENNKDLTEYDSDSNAIGDEAKEYFEIKDKVNQLKSTANMALSLPDLFFLSIPFVDEEDLSIYKIVTGILIIIVIFVAVIRAIFGKFWGE